MKPIKIFFIIFFIFNFTQLHSVENNSELTNKISKNIRCLICQGQSVYDSQSDFALSMKLVIEKKLEEGYTESQIYDYLKTLGITRKINNSDELSLSLVEEFKANRDKNVEISKKIDQYGQNIFNNVIVELKKYI